MRKYLKMTGSIGKTSRQETQAPANGHQLPIAQSWGNQFNDTEASPSSVKYGVIISPPGLIVMTNDKCETSL